MRPIIPDAALSQHIAILGKTGSGKTTAAKSAIVEPMLGAGRRVAIVDPTSAWWGLRTSRDGKGPGFPILVLGGDHGDLPLPALGGAAVARLIAEQNVNLVADTSALTVGERTRWFIDFATTLYRLNRAPLCLVIDEAHMFMPQGKVPDPDTGKMLHAGNTLASGGRSRGIRLVMLTQRPQKLHKDALTSADTLIALRVLAPHDRQAIEDWIKGCGDLKAGAVVLNSLASLQRGEGWVWYPEGAVLDRVTFAQIKTFDSSATPTDGATIATPKGSAEIDLTEIKAAMADAVAEAEANDPKKLRARIAELEREARKAAPAPTVDPGMLDAARFEGYQAAIRALMPMTDRLQTLRTALDEQLGALIDDLERWRKKHDSAPATPAPIAPHKAIAPARVPTHAPADRARPARSASAPGDSKLGNSGKRRILTALAQNPDGLTARKLSILTGISQSGGTWRTYLGELRGNGWAEGGSENLRITASGVAALGAFEPLPTGRDLIEYWRGRLGQSGKRAIFDAVIAAHPRTIALERVSEQTGIAMAGGTWRTYLGELRGLELIEGKGELRAAEVFFQ